MGDGEFEARERPFQSMNAVERIKAKFRDWARRRRGLKEEKREESILGYEVVESCGGRENG